MDAGTELSAVEIGRAPHVSALPVAAGRGAIPSADRLELGNGMMVRFDGDRTNNGAARDVSKKPCWSREIGSRR
jgi:hypothetical protein